MPIRGANQHRWKRSVNDEIRHTLEDAATELKLSWSSDSEYRPRFYPSISESVLNDLRNRIKNRPRSTKLPRSEPQQETGTLMDLFEEKIVKAVYEGQNIGSYKDALRKASVGGKRGRVVWRKLLRSINRAYEIGIHGVEVAPMPRVHFLHRELLDIVRLLKLNDLTSEGLAEFFDDLCPCGRKHQADAIRKLGQRIAIAR